MIPITLLLLFLSVVSADSISFNDCGSSYDLLKVNIEGCSNIPCTVKVDETFNISMEIISRDSTSNTLFQKVEIIVFGISTDAQVTPQDPCNSINCPIVVENSATYNAVVLVPSLPPELPAELKWVMTNERGHQVICMETQLYLERSFKTYIRKAVKKIGKF